MQLKSATRENASDVLLDHFTHDLSSTPDRAVNYHLCGVPGSNLRVRTAELLGNDPNLFKFHYLYTVTLTTCYKFNAESYGAVSCKNGVMRSWRACYLPAVRCKGFAYGPADVTATPNHLIK